MNKLLAFCLVILQLNSIAQNKLIISGPMVGYTNTREAALWIQTKKSTQVKFAYFIENQANKKWWTQSITSNKSNLFIVKLIADSVMPGNKYNYEVYINNVKLEFNYPLKFKTPPVWKYQTDAPDFTIACGSGTYVNEKLYDRVGKAYGSKYEIFPQIAKQQPDAMIWLGDNIYLRGDEWNSNTGIAHRYTHTRSLPELQSLLASTANYAIWDDHDAGPNDCDGSFWNIDATLDYFELFWANPSVGVKNIKGAVSYFNWGDVDFFLLDNRYHREPNRLKKEGKTMLGEKQLNWLKESLSYSSATFKVIVIGGQVLNTAKNYETYANYGFDKERQEILDFIINQEIRGVFFLSGDRHFTEFSMLSENNISIYDLTVSPLTSGVGASSIAEINKNRVKGSLVETQNFALLKFHGKHNERILNINIIDAKGNLLWEKNIYENHF
ncbi:MAG: alkaline phosphatase family protein [Bacteroidales bacterium]|nr:alkaline phosphatase family protein [Bacteroidales bacterium]